MRIATLLLGSMLLASIVATAQNTQPMPTAFGVAELPNWQIAMGYQFNRININQTPFNTSGLNTTVVRFLSNWLGVEAQIGAGFGNTGPTGITPNLDAKTVFLGFGPRLAIRGRGKYEPWIHGNFGVEHFRFTQTGITPLGILGSNTGLGYTAGGGVDYHLDANFSARAEADVVGSWLFGGSQRHFQMIGGLVFSF